MNPRIMNTHSQNSKAYHVKSTHLTGGETKARKSDLPTAPELASNRKSEPALLPLPTVFSPALCCVTFPRKAAKNGAEALGKSPELMTQCDLNGKPILKQRTSQNVLRQALYPLSQPVLQNHCPPHTNYS